MQGGIGDVSNRDSTTQKGVIQLNNTRRLWKASWFLPGSQPASCLASFSSDTHTSCLNMTKVVIKNLDPEARFRLEHLINICSVLGSIQNKHSNKENNTQKLHLQGHQASVSILKQDKLVTICPNTPLFSEGGEKLSSHGQRDDSVFKSACYTFRGLVFSSQQPCQVTQCQTSDACSCSSANCTRAHIDTSIHINKNLLKIEKWISNLRSTGSMKIQRHLQRRAPDPK